MSEWVYVCVCVCVCGSGGVGGGVMVGVGGVVHVCMFVSVCQRKFVSNQL